MEHVRVIIADDSATIRSCIQDMLSDMPHIAVVGEATDAPEAIRLVRGLDPDVAVLDISMPGGGGLEVLRQLQNMEHSPVRIMLTNYPYPEYRHQCMEHGADFFFDKSSEFDRIPAVLSMLAESGDVRDFSRHVAMEQLVEMSERTQQLAEAERKHREIEEASRRREAILFAVGHAADCFLKAKSWTDVTDEVLDHLGKAAEVCSAYVFPVKNGVPEICERAFEWVSPSASEELGRDRVSWLEAGVTIPPEWCDKLRSNEPVVRTRGSLSPEEAELLSPLTVSSLVMIPLFVGDDCWGFMGVSDCRSERRWLSAEIEALRTAASTLTAAIRRQKAECSLQHYSERLTEMVESRTAELREAQERLVRKGKLAVLGQLASGVGHELRNPLSVIANAAYYLKTVLREEDGVVMEYLDMIAGEVQTAEKTVSDLLMFSRTQMTDRARHDAGALVRRALERTRVPDGTVCETDLPEGLPPVLVDGDQVVRILVNLLDNAWQSMPEGGHVAVRVWRDNDRLCIAVQDEGCGISAEDLPHIFEPLFTTKARGIGLGLALARNLAECNGGELTVRSESGRGSTFVLSLPVCATAAVSPTAV